MIVKQKEKSDCGICCIAMATLVDYQKVYDIGIKGKHYVPGKGLYDSEGLLDDLAEELCDASPSRIIHRKFYRPFPISDAYFKSMFWGRRAILSVPSLNIPNGWHAVFYDGTNLFDPSTKFTYDSFDDIKIVADVTVFNEAPHLRV